MQAHNQVCNEGVIRINYFIVYSFLMASTENSECIAYTLHACIHWGDRAGSRASHKVDTFWLCWIVNCGRTHTTYVWTFKHLSWRSISIHMIWTLEPWMVGLVQPPVFVASSVMILFDPIYSMVHNRWARSPEPEVNSFNIYMHVL